MCTAAGTISELENIQTEAQGGKQGIENTEEIIRDTHKLKIFEVCAIIIPEKKKRASRERDNIQESFKMD